MIPQMEMRILESSERLRHVTANYRLHLSHPAQMAFEMAKSLALGAVPEGYDKRGSQAHRMLTPDEVADRAIAIADAIYARFEQRPDLAMINPTIDELLDEGGRTGFAPSGSNGAIKTG